MDKMTSAICIFWNPWEIFQTSAWNTSNGYIFLLQSQYTEAKWCIWIYFNELYM